MKARLSVCACLWLMAVALPPPAGAAPDVRSVQESQREAEARRNELQQRIRNVQQELELRESERKDASDALRKSEQALSDINRRLHELGNQEKQLDASLARLDDQITRQQADLEQRRETLAGQLREQYASDLSPWSLWLSGDDPQETGRNLAYLDYVSQARAAAVQRLDEEIAALAALQEEQRTNQEKLVTLRTEADAQRREREAQQRERAGVLARLEGKIRAQRVEASRLSRDDERLGNLVDDLGKQLDAARREAEARRQEQLRLARERAAAEKAAAEKAAAERAAAARLAAERAAAERAARAQAQAEARVAQAEARAEQARAATQGPTSTLRQVEGPRLSADSGANQTTATPPPAPVVQAPVEPPAPPAAAADVSTAEPVRERLVNNTPPPPRDTAPARGQGPAGGTNGLRPGLKPPVAGNLMARYGTQKPDGGAWRGQLIAAPEGAPVRAVESGTVVYANWLRGFGNIIIVDHGREYLSVYAHNQSLLKQVGDAVARQETIASVGATGGQVDSGLYFEVRHRGAPVDPARFVAR